MLEGVPSLDDFTPIERRMILVLDDGQMHDRIELWRCLQDPYLEEKRIHNHLTSLREKLLPYNRTIIPQAFQRKVYYRLIVIHTPIFTSDLCLLTPVQVGDS